MRPTERAPPGIEALRDREVADWLEARPRAALLFWDADDAACQRLRARLEIAVAATGASVGCLDVRHEPLVARALGVASVPTLVVFRDGEVADRVMGSPPEAVLRDALR